MAKSNFQGCSKSINGIIDVGLDFPAAADGVAQRGRHVILPADLVEGLRPPFARDDLVAQ